MSVRSCVICDLCGKPLDIHSNGRWFKIKDYQFHAFMWEWTRIDAHDECVKRLLNAVAETGVSETGVSES